MDAGPASWTIAPGRTLALDRPRIMGILNATPDSFFDGGVHRDPGRAAAAAGRMADAGADVLDVGGASTRPGAEPVAARAQIERVVPVIRAIGAAGIGLPISIDTTSSAVAAAALDAGATIVNDVSGGTDDERIIALAAERGCGLVLMHRLVPPDADRYSDRYERPPSYAGGVVEAVRGALAARLAAATAGGVRRGQIVLDPGLGFGKTVEQNLALIRGTGQLLRAGCPILSAASRKSFVGRAGLERDSAASERLGASIACSVAHLHAGARLFRVHDVGEQAAALRVAWALLERPGGGPV